MSASTSRSPACSPRAWSCTRPTAPRTASGSTPAEVKIETDGETRRASHRHRRDGRDRRDREDVEVEAQHGRSRRDHGHLRRRRRALVHAVGFAARARRRMDRARRAGRLALHQRLWRLVGEAAEIAARGPGRAGRSFAPAALAVRKAAHRALARVTDDIEKLHFNVCVAAIYEFANALRRRSAISIGRSGASRRLRAGPCAKRLIFSCNCSTR